MILLIPCCGESERFNGIKKQFLMHPNGMPLPLFSASGITGYDKRYFIFLQNDYFLHGDTEFKYYQPEEILLLNHSTKSQVHTIQLSLQTLINANQINGSDSIYIKDCDNYFRSAAIKNCVSTIDPAMGVHSLVNLNKKSYSLVDNLKRLHCIKERGMYTNYMNVGGYGFENIFDFLIYSNKKKYISEVVQAAINDGEVFAINDVSQYIDYGTQTDWDEYVKTLSR